MKSKKNKFEISKWNIISAWNQIFKQIREEDITKDIFDYLDFEILLGKEASNLIKKIEDGNIFQKNQKEFLPLKV